MDLLQGMLAIRALADGVPALVEALERPPAVPPAAWAAFARAHNVREWLTPALDDERARAALGPALAQDLERVRAERPGRVAALVTLTGEVADALHAADVEVLFLKGLHLAQRFAGGLERRHQYDLDLAVRPHRLEAALGALGGLGFGAPPDEVGCAVAAAARGRASRRHEELTLRRSDGQEVDVHFQVKRAWFPGLDADALWRDRQPFALGPRHFDTLCDEHTLLLLLLSIALDVRRGACRGKHLLDVFLMVRALEAGIDWDAFLERRRREGLGRTAATVLAMVLDVFAAADEVPALTDALGRQRDLVRLADAGEAVRLLTRPRRSQANRAWFDALHPPTTAEGWARAVTSHAPHRALRVLGGWTRGGFEGPRGGHRFRTRPGLRDLPPPLRRLLEASGLDARRAVEITTLRSRRDTRRTWRIELADARIVKGRTHEPPAVDRMRRAAALLPATGFARLLAAEDVATIETWCPGAPVDPGDPEVLARAGALLGGLHGVVPPEDLPGQDPRLRAWSSEAEAWLAALRHSGALAPGEAERVAGRLRDTRPTGATWGLQHADLCAENLVEHEGALACVDNTTVAMGLLESDLAQTFYRWPMSPEGRAAFLDGYRRHRSPASYLEHAVFWDVTGALRAAAWRQRVGAGSLDVPLAVLRRDAP